MISESERLEYLHDAVLQSLALTVDQHGKQAFFLEVICHPAAGYQPWDGKGIVVSVADISVCHANSYGYSYGADTVDTCTSEVSEAFLKMLCDSRPAPY